MTEEEIRPIAEDYVEEYCHCPDGEYTDGSLVCAGIGTALIVSRQLEKRIANLEKENAELKKKLKPENCLKLLAKEGYIKFTSEQLTKAKEIIKNLLSAYTTYADSFDDRDNEIVDEAEQFISEVEKCGQ